MIVASTLEEKMAVLVETPDDLLPLFGPLERATIIALKALQKGNQNATGTPACSSEDTCIGGRHGSRNGATA